MLSTHPGEHGTLIILSSQLRRGMVGAVEDRTTTPVLPAHLPFEHTHMHGSRHNDEQPFSVGERHFNRGAAATPQRNSKVCIRSGAAVVAVFPQHQLLLLSVHIPRPRHELSLERNVHAVN